MYRPADKLDNLSAISVFGSFGEYTQVYCSSVFAIFFFSKQDRVGGSNKPVDGPTAAESIQHLSIQLKKNLPRRDQFGCGLTARCRDLWWFSVFDVQWAKDLSFFFT